MDSLPDQHIDSLPKDAREDAYWKISAIGVLRGKGLPEDEVAKKAQFNSLEVMHFQLKRWGLPGLVPSPQAKRRKVKGGGGNKSEQPPLTAAHHLFEAAIESFQRAIRQLPLRRDYRQDGHVVSELSGPLLEHVGHVGDDPGYNPLIPPPDAEPDEHGWVKYSLAEAHRLEPAGAGRYPNEQVAALIGAALLFGESADELLDLLRPGADDKVREKIHHLIEGKDGLKRRARQIASIMRGGTSGQGLREEESYSPEEHAAARFKKEWRQGDVPDAEILEKLRSNPALLRKTKKRRQITLKDVEHWGTLGL
jgi:hypothetical protein